MSQLTKTPWTRPDRDLPDPKEPVRARYAPGEITQLCEAALASARALLDAIAATAPQDRTVETTLLRFEQVMGDISDAIQPLSMMSYVYPDPAISAEGSACEEKTGIFMVEVYTRRDLYNAIHGVSPRTPDEARLYDKTIRHFEKNGLNLPDERLAKVRDMMANLSRFETRFSTNLNNDTTLLEFTPQELSGVPEGVLAGFKKTDRGTYLVTTKTPDYFPVMQNAVSSETRKQMQYAFVNRQADENTRLLEDAIVLRDQIARELGFATWAGYRIDGRMAGKPEQVLAFLAALKEPLKEKTTEEMARLLAVKKTLNPAATAVDSWDILFLKEKLRMEKYALDDETIRQYFPLDATMQGIFDQFSGLLGIRFSEVKDARVWADGVKLYRIENAPDGNTIAYLYADLFPRQGKYGHMMMYQLKAGRAGPDGSYSHPVSALIGNVRAPEGNKPSLLSHDDLEGLFHELGHALHVSLTRAPYATLSGYNVEWDFVETPSQALEEWAWQPQVLDAISGLYTDPSQKLPADLRTRMIEARDMDAGMSYSRMLMLSSEDMVFHTAHGSVDVTDISDAMYEEQMGIPPIEGGHEPATIDHFMGGYDAGYYSYLWSKVYALNVYARFERDGLTNTATGQDYRRWILEPGNMQDGDVLLQGFLGKEPGMDVFYERLHIPMPVK
ncbi:MAG: M3 family metallopeptidase [Methanoregula sp.]|nr:M3 family metallopeptidase [Methanoregula sp.]